MTNPQGTSPHALATHLLGTRLGKQWRIVHGDRPLDAPPVKPTLVLYTSSITNKNAATAGLLVAEITAIIFAPQTTAEKTEESLFQTFIEFADALNGISEMLHWDEAQRVIMNDMPAYQTRIYVPTTYMKEK